MALFTVCASNLLQLLSVIINGNGFYDWLWWSHPLPFRCTLVSLWETLSVHWFAGLLIWLLDHPFKAFLVADTQLYKRLCPSVGRSVGPSRSSWKVGKRAFPPLPTRPQLMAVYPALLMFVRKFVRTVVTLRHWRTQHGSNELVLLVASYENWHDYTQRLFISWVKELIRELIKWRDFGKLLSKS